MWKAYAAAIAKMSSCKLFAGKARLRHCNGRFQETCVAYPVLAAMLFELPAVNQEDVLDVEEVGLVHFASSASSAWCFVMA
jgi:hypothetical protein